jgi:hypothetical protein
MKVPKRQGRVTDEGTANFNIGFDMNAQAVINKYTVHVELRNKGRDFNDAHLFPDK